MSSFSRDVALASRSLRRSPTFTTVAVLTIALGIGASAAIFSVMNAVLLKPLPYADEERLVTIWSDLTARSLNDFPMPPGDFHDLRRDVAAFEQVGAVVTGQQPLMNDDGEPEMLRTAGVTPNFLRMLGARAIAGRDFVDADGAVVAPPPGAGDGAAQQAPAAPPPPASAILSHGFWQRRFGGSSDVIGKVLRIGGQSVEVVGVLEPDVELLWPPSAGIERRPEIYSALRVDYENGSRINVFLRVIGKLKPGVTREQAQEQVNRLVLDLRERFPIKKTAGLVWRVEPMKADLIADVRPAITALMGAVMFVLLIACANVANLMLVRASTRARELAVRSALGGSRGALIRQVFAESLVVAIAGAALGLALAWAGIRVLQAIGPQDLPRLDAVSLDPGVVAFATIAALLSAVLFGSVPAIRASRPDLARLLAAGGRNAGLAGGKRLRSGVVVAEVALAFVLLIGSGLMIRSFVALHRASPGFDATGALTFRLSPILRQEEASRAAAVRELRSRLAAIPGVTAVTAVSPMPLDGTMSNMRWGTAEAVADPSKFQQANLHIVHPGYFEVMRTRVIDGRTFTEDDNVPGRRLLVVDRRFAEKAFPGKRAVGERIFARVAGPEPEWWDVIGVVEHQRHETLARDGREGVFVADGFFGFGAANRWVLRTSGDPLALASQARAAVRAFDRGLTINEVEPLTAFLDRARASTRFALVLIATFAVIALVLAVVGLYGVLATLVRQRTAEIGVRMAFGASQGAIARLVVGEGLRLGALGIGAGLVAALWLTRGMSTMLVGISPTDPSTFAGIALVFLAVAAVACWLPARRAAGVDPAVALRGE